MSSDEARVARGALSFTTGRAERASHRRNFVAAADARARARPRRSHESPYVKYVKNEVAITPRKKKIATLATCDDCDEGFRKLSILPYAFLFAPVAAPIVYSWGIL